MRELPIEVDAATCTPLGMAPGAFLRDYWQKRPLLVRNAFPGFVPPLAPEDLAGLACEEFALARIVEHDRARDRWTLRTGPFEESVFPAMPGHDWTLLVQDVDKWDADVQRLLAHFAFLPAWRIDDVMVSFAAPGGSVGAHVDQYDVFLLQGEGHRRWAISTDPAAPTGFRDDVELKLLQSFTPTHEWVLAPGDMLYLPPGVPHHGVAEDACLTFSIGMRAPSSAELIVDYAEYVAEALGEGQRYADPDVSPPADPAEIDDAALQRVAGALDPLGRLDAGALRDWFGRFITRYRLAGDVSPPPSLPSPQQVADRLARGEVLLRHPFARLAWTRRDGGALLFANGEAFPTDPSTARAVCAGGALDAGRLQPLGAPGMALVHHLIGMGALVLTRTDRP